MIKTDEEALICDLAETYQIYEYKQLPLSMVAVFANGLRDNSRIKMKMSESKYSVLDTTLFGILDRLTLLVYSKTKDAQKGKNYPKLLSDMLYRKKDDEMLSFRTGEEFEKVRKMILEEVENGN